MDTDSNIWENQIWCVYMDKGIVDFGISVMMVENSYAIVNHHQSRIHWLRKLWNITWFMEKDKRSLDIMTIIMEIYITLNIIMKTQE